MPQPSRPFSWEFDKSRCGPGALTREGRFCCAPAHRTGARRGALPSRASLAAYNTRRPRKRVGIFFSFTGRNACICFSGEGMGGWVGGWMPRLTKQAENTSGHNNWRVDRWQAFVAESERGGFHFFWTGLVVMFGMVRVSRSSTVGKGRRKLGGWMGGVQKKNKRTLVHQTPATARIDLRD